MRIHSNKHNRVRIFAAVRWRATVHPANVKCTSAEMRLRLVRIFGRNIWADMDVGVAWELVCP